MSSIWILMTAMFFSYCDPEISRLQNFIQEWWSVPYKFGGASKAGIDCSKYVQRLYKDVFCIDLPGVSWKQWDATERVSRDSLQIGDLVFFYSPKSPSKWHVGVYLWTDLFVHASNKSEDIKISSLNESNYKKNFRGAGRILETKPEWSMDCVWFK